MKKLFLLIFAFTLLCTWSMAGADTSPNLSTSSANTDVENVVNKDIETAKLDKDALAQEALEALAGDGPATSLSSEGFLPAPTVTFVPEKAPYSGVINVPDENVILTGGETCASATAIPSLPYTDSDNTAGHIDDYDAVCPYTGSTSPDLVYSYVPEVDIMVTITVCLGQTDYDTKIYVYENDCTSVEIDCSDDDCTAPIYGSPYNSIIECLPLTGGNTYYIVVDGYGGDAGPYTLEVTECAPPLPAACCVDLVCTDMMASDCADAGGIWNEGELCETYECPTAPDNDLCENPEQVTGPYPVNLCGTNVGATIDCPGILDWYTVWYEIELPYAVNNLEITICSEVDLASTTVGIVLAECDCSYTIRDGGLAFIVCDNTFTGYNQIWSNLPGPGIASYPAWIADGVTLEGVPFCLDINVTEPAEPFGACCVEEVCIGTMNEGDCLAACGTWYEGEDCDLGFECPAGGGCLTQAPNLVNGIFSDTDCDLCGTGIQVLADQVVFGAATDIYGLTWWGGYFPNNNPTGTNDFTIIFRADNAGVPGAALYTLTGQAPTMTITGTLFGVDEWENVLDLTGEGINVGPGVIFIEIYTTTTDGESYFWETGDLDVANGIMGQAYSFAIPEEPWNYDTATDMALVIDGNCAGGPVGDVITIEIFTDSYPGETTWEVLDHATQEVYASGGPYTGFPNTLFTEVVCVDAEGCYDFVIYDAYGDGICCTYGNGYYNVDFNGDLVGSGAEFGDSETTPDIGNGCVTCIVECPQDGIPELEACGDADNGGCNNVLGEPPTEPTYEAIECNTIICGTHWGLDGTRDTDWFELTLTEPATVSATITAEYQVALFILEIVDCYAEPPDPDVIFIETGDTQACEPLTISTVLDAGTWVIWTGPGSAGVPRYEGLPCSGYVLEVNCTAAPLGACCDIDFTCLGDMNEFDCATAGGAGWYEGQTCANFDCPVPTMVGLATTGNIPDCGVSNYGVLGDYDTQLTTYNWNTTVAANYEASFVMGDDATRTFSSYGEGDCYVPSATSLLNMDDTYNPFSRFSDGGVMGGVSVDYCGTGYTDPTDAMDIFVHSYHLTNNSGAAISNFFAGLYFDWDIDLTEPTITFDRARNLIIQEGGDGTAAFGLCLLNPTEVTLASLAAVVQQDYIYPNVGWLMADLYNIMSDGGDGVWDVADADMSSLISIGPQTIADGGTVDIHIAVIGGATTADVQASADFAATLELDVCPAEVVGGCGDYVIGDYNGSDQFNVADIILAFSKLKTGSPDAYLLCDCEGNGNEWAVAMDVNNSCAFNIADVIWGFGKLKGQPNLLEACELCPPGGSPRPGGDQPLIVPNLESKVKLSTGSGME